MSVCERSPCENAPAEGDDVMRTEKLCVSVNGTCLIDGVDARLARGRITCIVGPSGSGKSTLIRSLNRIGDEVRELSTTGRITLDGVCIRQAFPDVSLLRQRVGMVFQKPCVFPRSIQENVLFGVRKKVRLSKPQAAALVEETLRAATLWEEVADRLAEPATALSLGQQQRLCIARSLAMKPDILLLDEPTASVDPLSGRKIENTLMNLRPDITPVVVTHDLRQMLRIADRILLIIDGELVEQGSCEHMLKHSNNPKTRNYLAEVLETAS